MCCSFHLPPFCELESSHLLAVAVLVILSFYIFFVRRRRIQERNALYAQQQQVEEGNGPQFVSTVTPYTVPQLKQQLQTESIGTFGGETQTGEYFSLQLVLVWCTCLLYSATRIRNGAPSSGLPRPLGGLLSVCPAVPLSSKPRLTNHSKHASPSALSSGNSRN